MISVATALDHVLALVGPLGAECVPLRSAAGRVLAEPCFARRNQPPFPAAAMDGYAVSGDPSAGDRFHVIGESAAGHGYAGTIAPDQAVRIFTGAPVPEGATRILIQEDVIRDGDTITCGSDLDENPYIRAAGSDFRTGTRFYPSGRLRAVDIALLAAMNHADVPVRRRPQVALIATGDELVMPGEVPRCDQIVTSNTFGLAAMIEAAGGIARMLPVARDTPTSLSAAFDLARGADLIVTIGGASDGDHDLVASVAEARGMERSFYKVAMRPGKPLMAGRIGGTAMVGLPGNPVSSMVCGTIFILPMIRAMLGLKVTTPTATARLTAALPANGSRAHYMRGSRTADGVAPVESQDSARLHLLADADVLIVRQPDDPARNVGDTVTVIDL